MRPKVATREELARELDRLTAQLEEAVGTLRAIRNGEVDALVVCTEGGERVFTLKGADHGYRLLIETMNEGALTLLMDGTILYANGCFARILRFPLEKVIGASIHSFVAPADRQTLIALLEHGGQGSARAEMAFRTTDGVLLPVLVSVNAVSMEGTEGTRTVVVTDLTEQKRSEAIVAAEKLARSILDQAGEAIVVCNEKGQVIRASQAAHQLCGGNPILQPFDRVFPLFLAAGATAGPADASAKPDLDTRRFSLAALRNGESLHGIEARLHRSDGEVVDLLLTAGPLWSGSNEILGWVVTLTDITPQKRLEEALRQRADALMEADRRKDEFLAMLAHELRNPLAPILNAVQLLRLRGPDDPPLQRASSVVERQVQQMARLLNDLLEVSRISRGKVELRKERVELQTIVTNAVQTSRPLMELRQQVLSITLPPQPILLEADPTRLEQVFVNLLNNAVKYTDPGGRIELLVQPEGETVLLRLRDTGRGISPEVLPHIFDLFVQSERSLDRSEGGLGIGLTLVKRLVEMHGGTVAAHSDGIGQGSEFAVCLPTLPAERPDRSRALRPAGGSEGRSVRVLLVEDNLDAARTLAELLELLGHEVRMAHDGPTALAIAAGYRPEVVLLDLGLPVMDGYEVARRLRQEVELAEVRLVALTGYGQEEDRRRASEAGFDHHLVKPVELGAIQELLADGAELTARRVSEGRPPFR